jgi:hypothetical protein
MKIELRKFITLFDELNLVKLAAFLEEAVKRGLAFKNNTATAFGY